MLQLSWMIRRSLAGAGAELVRHPWRTVLICQGILWAVALMVAPASILQGSRQAALERAHQLGTDRIQVEVEPGATSVLEVEDLSRLRDALASDYSATIVSGQGIRRTIIEGDERIRGWIVATDQEEFSARSLELIDGRWFKPGMNPPEVVFEEPLARRLFSDAEDSFPLDDARIWTAPGRFGTWLAGISKVTDELPESARIWKVVGVIRSAGESGINPLGFGEDHRFANLVEGVLKMLGVASESAPWLRDGMAMHLDRENFDAAPVDWIVISTDPMQVTEVSHLVENTLIERGRTPLVYANAAWSILASPELDGYLVLHDVFFAITAVIGWLVLTNLLLLTGRQRRAEVGLRRAEGASRADIFWQFLWEGVFISLLGAILGALAGVAFATLRVTLDPSAVLAASWPWNTIFESMVIVIVGAALASAGPAWAVSGTDPALLLREGR